MQSFAFKRESYVVYSKGKRIAIGSADDLQELFNQRANQLRVYLRRIVFEPEDVQLQNKFQVESLSDYLASVECEKQYARDVLQEYNDRIELPSDPLLYEQLFNPNCIQLQKRIERRQSSYHKYERPKKVQQWKQEAAIQCDALTLDEITDLERESYLQAMKEHEQLIPVGRRCSKDKWMNQLTSIEEEHLEQKKAQAQARREANQARFYK